MLPEEQAIKKRYPGATMKWSAGTVRIIDEKGNALGSVPIDHCKTLMQNGDEAWRDAAKQLGVETDV